MRCMRSLPKTEESVAVEKSGFCVIELYGLSLGKVKVELNQN